jgi:hypothetical protein
MWRLVLVLVVLVLVVVVGFVGKGRWAVGGESGRGCQNSASEEGCW